jgi:hypothetical protein
LGLDDAPVRPGQGVPPDRHELFLRGTRPRSPETDNDVFIRATRSMVNKADRLLRGLHLRV